jgi:hypothetical protein
MLNTTSHRYSVVAFLLFLGCILLALPMRVFSQVDSVSAVGQTTTETELKLEADPVDDSELPPVEAATNTTPVDVAPPVVTDNYSRERLPNDDVFNDFVIGPGRFELALEPGQSRTVELVVSNRMGVEKVFSFETEDAKGTVDGSQPLVLLGDDRGPYTIKDYISVPYNNFTLKHAERARIPVTVSIPADADPGGRYGSLLISIVSDRKELNAAGAAAPASVLVSRIGTLFFISAPGTTKAAGETLDFATVNNQSVFTDSPIPMSVVFENTGDVHLNPYGEIRITNLLGDEVGFVELAPWFVLPNAIRNRVVDWDRELLIGRYTAIAQINRGYDDIIDTQTIVFWVLPWKILLPIFIALFLIFAAIRYIATRFEFKRK